MTVQIEFVDKLSQCGMAAVEAAAFVNPKRVPQMDGAAEVLGGVWRAPGVAYPVLVPNLKGYEQAVAAGAQSVAVMTAASETFSRNNVNASVEGALERALCQHAAPPLGAPRERASRMRGGRSGWDEDCGRNPLDRCKRDIRCHHITS